jgi:uncharacterized ubiquitin-like protein YukD
VCSSDLNTYNYANIDLYIPSANPIHTGIALYTSGEAFPVQDGTYKTLYIRGKTI